MMHVPDGLNAAAIRLLLDSDKDTRRTVDLAKRADILLFGIGRADIMAKRRGADKKADRISDRPRGSRRGLGLLL